MSRPSPPVAPLGGTYELRFRSLFDDGRALAFPCDAQGRVDESGLSDQARHNYLRARQVIGKDWATPLVQVRLDD
ncbi:MAG: hypothetical protein V4739_17665 [Pseudomonadota bacterium]